VPLIALNMRQVAASFLPRAQHNNIVVVVVAGVVTGVAWQPSVRLSVCPSVHPSVCVLASSRAGLAFEQRIS